MNFKVFENDNVSLVKNLSEFDFQDTDIFLIKCGLMI